MNPNEEFIGRLRVARGYVQNGWTQGVYHNGHGCYCAQGALNMAGIREQQYRLLVGKKLLAPYPSTDRLITWNDRQYRTKEEVLAMFDNSIAALESA